MQSKTILNSFFPLYVNVVKNFFQLLILNLCFLGFTTTCYSQVSILKPVSTEDQLKAKTEKSEISSKSEIENNDAKIEGLVSRALSLQLKISIVCKAKEDKDVYSKLQVKYADKLKTSCPSFPGDTFGKAEPSFLKQWADQNPAELFNYNIILEKVLTDTIQ
jgi:hypothetical protein